MGATYERDPLAYHSVIAISRAALGAPRAFAYEEERAEDDLVRTLCKTQLLTPEEVRLRYEWSWGKVYTNERDSDGRPVPLAEARILQQKLTAHERAKPLPGAVYAVTRPFSEPGAIPAALLALMQAMDACPLAVRLHPADYAAYLNALEPHYYGFGEVSIHGVPVTAGRYLTEGELVATYPVPVEE